jgi:hypothetical protein
MADLDATKKQRRDELRCKRRQIRPGGRAPWPSSTRIRHRGVTVHVIDPLVVGGLHNMLA